MKELEALRSLDWDREDHKKQMEVQMMWTHQYQKSRRTPVRVAAAVLLLCCGALFGAVSTTIVYEFGNQTITTTEFDDGSTHVTIEEDGELVFDEVLNPGEMLFQVVEEDEGDDGEDAGNPPLVILTPVEPASSESGDDQ